MCLVRAVCVGGGGGVAVCHWSNVCVWGWGVGWLCVTGLMLTYGGGGGGGCVSLVSC